MKRTISVLLALVMLFTLAACGKKEQEPQETKEPDYAEE